MEECGHKGLNCYEAGREIESLRQQLATTQAHAAQLREALEWIVEGEADNGCIATGGDMVRKAEEFLALPQDRTALDAAIADELERVAEVLGTSYESIQIRNRANELRNKP